MAKFGTILYEAFPVWLMIGLIPIIQRDTVLTTVYCLIIILAFMIKHERHDMVIFCFGFVIMILVELFFVSTGVETFTRNSLFGFIPLWLPFLWGYGFVAIKRSVRILGE